MSSLTCVFFVITMMYHFSKNNHLK